jgi:CBS domain-containing protein
MSPRAACRLESLGFTAVYDYTAGKADWLAAGLTTEGNGATRPRPGTLARTEIPRCGLRETVAVARSRVEGSGEDRCVVVSDTGVVLGVLDGTVRGDESRAAADAMRSGPTTVRAHEDLDGLLERMHRRNVNSVLVTDPEGRLLGIFHRDDGDAVAARGLA